MFFRRSVATEPAFAPTAPNVDESVRRQGAVETLNLVARSLAEAITAARADAVAGKPDNFLAGQLMAYAQVLSWIERERDFLQQQLVLDAGLHTASADSVWDTELALLRALPVSSEELFRLAMDFRKVEEPPAPEGDCEALVEGDLGSSGDAPATAEASAADIIADV